MQHPIYAIADIHGQFDMMQHVLSLIEVDGGPDAQVVFLGDYVDRGPNSHAVIQTLIDGKSAGRNWTILKGNHDRYLTRFLNDQNVHDSRTRPDLTWLDPVLGGDKTLQSYGVTVQNRPVTDIHTDALNAVPAAHRRFLDSLDLTYATQDLLFVHAGIRPGIPLSDQVEDDLIWIRAEFHNDPRDHGPLIVHGHTALDAPQHFGNRVDLDAGAGWGRALTVAVFEGRTCWLLTPKGRVPLRP
jgi:serine/threonine protein phosphatase 1